MSADDEEHSESEFTIPQKILLFLALIETTFYSVGEYEFMRGELKKYYLPVWSVRIEKYFSRS